MISPNELEWNRWCKKQPCALKEELGCDYGEHVSCEVCREDFENAMIDAFENAKDRIIEEKLMKERGEQCRLTNK